MRESIAYFIKELRKWKYSAFLLLKQKPATQNYFEGSFSSATYRDRWTKFSTNCRRIWKKTKQTIKGSSKKNSVNYRIQKNLQNGYQICFYWAIEHTRDHKVSWLNFTGNQLKNTFFNTIAFNNRSIYLYLVTQLPDQPSNQLIVNNWRKKPT